MSSRDDGWTWAHGRGAIALTPGTLGRPAARGDARLTGPCFYRHSIVIKVPETGSWHRDVAASDNKRQGQNHLFAVRGH
jgi:hypothetical protein